LQQLADDDYRPLAFNFTRAPPSKLNAQLASNAPSRYKSSEGMKRKIEIEMDNLLRGQFREKSNRRSNEVIIFARYLENGKSFRQPLCLLQVVALSHKLLSPSNAISIFVFTFGINDR
jgi:hypothetical protein